MTMQPDELLAARRTMGLTQGELAERLGLTPQFIGMMERGEKPIEKRTALAVQQVYNATVALYGSADRGDFADDVPIARAQIIWDEDMSPRIKVVGIPGDDDRRYSSSFGACNSDWVHADTVGQLLRLLSRFPEWTVAEGIPASEVHDALMVIPEYRRAVAYGFTLVKYGEQ